MTEQNEEMSQHPEKKPVRPAAQAVARQRPVPAAQQQSLKDKARRDTTSDDEEEEEEEETWLQEVLRQSPGWLTSMVVHMILLLVMALVT